MVLRSGGGGPRPDPQARRHALQRHPSRPLDQHHVPGPAPAGDHRHGVGGRVDRDDRPRRHARATGFLRDPPRRRTDRHQAVEAGPRRRAPAVSSARSIEEGLALYASLKTTTPDGAVTSSLRIDAGRNRSRPFATLSRSTPSATAAAAAASALAALCRPTTGTTHSARAPP